MSPVVTADFAQVAPERSVSAVHAADTSLAISVSGPTHTPQADGAGNRFQVTVQRRIPGTSDDAGWLTDAAAGFVIAGDAAAPQPPILWSGTVTRPATPVTGEYRLLIEEFEPHATFRGSLVATERIVFVETVPL